jgi:hypothetical protein
VVDEEYRAVWVSFYTVALNFLWAGIFCGLEVSVGWKFLWAGILCGLEVSVGWKFLWAGILCKWERDKNADLTYCGHSTVISS